MFSSFKTFSSQFLFVILLLIELLNRFLTEFQPNSIPLIFVIIVVFVYFVKLILIFMNLFILRSIMLIIAMFIPNFIPYFLLRSVLYFPLYWLPHPPPYLRLRLPRCLLLHFQHFQLIDLLILYFQYQLIQIHPNLRIHFLSYYFCQRDLSRSN